MTTTINYDVLYYIYIPFIFLPLLLGYIINRLSTKESNKISFVPVFLLSFIPIFNISIAFVFVLNIIYGIFNSIFKSKIFTKIVNNFENRNLKD